MNNDIYKRLTPQRKEIVDAVLENLQNGAGLWKQGWVMTGVPESAITHKPYRGINNFMLSIVSMAMKYKDNRWLTFKQMQDKGWNFKTDEEGKSIAKGHGVNIEFFELLDKETGKPFSRHTLLGMTQEEKDEYIRENIKFFRKHYRVFNGDLIDGIPEQTKHMLDEDGASDRIEKLLDYWSENESEIIYGGNDAYYVPLTDEIHLPNRKDFLTMQELYSTALHEMGHSTGHKSRLNRDLSGKFGIAEYAEEELRAEIASMFLEQDYGLDMSKSNIQNNSAYIQSWKNKIEENPNVLFTAIAEADRIAKFVKQREQQNIQKRIEYFAVMQDENEVGDTVYKVFMTSSYGQTSQVLRSYETKEEMLKDFDEMQHLPFWKDAEFCEVSLEELKEKSIERYEAEQAEEESQEYVLPSSLVTDNAKEQPNVQKGIDTLTKMTDRDIVEKASEAEMFQRLYDGEKVYANDEDNEKHLMMRIAVYAEDKEQLIRIFKSSNLYREDKPNSYYNLMAEDVILDVEEIKGRVKPIQPSTNKSNKGSFNAKR